MNQQRSSISTFNQSPPGLGFLPGIGTYGPNTNVNHPPPLPPRPTVNSYQSYSGYRPGYMGMYNGYNSLGANNWSLGRYGGYSSYPYASNFDQFGGPSGDVENRFVQFAEESSRPAFQSIESIVQTFSAVTMMLESTFFAMSSSFRAILSVAENVGRVRTMFGQLLSTFALIRFAKWLYKTLLKKLGLSGDNPDEEVWQKTVLKVLNGEKTGPATWPILMFLGLLIVIPYLIHKLVRNVHEHQQNGSDPKEWFKLNEPIYSATANYDFVARSPEELSLKAGQKIVLAPQSLQSRSAPGWSKATDSVNVGFVPSNYITIVGQMKKKPDVESSTGQNPSQNNCPDNIEDPVAPARLPDVLQSEK